MNRVTGIGGIFFKAKDPKAMQAWYRRHLGIDVQDWGGTAFRWTDAAKAIGHEDSRAQALAALACSVPVFLRSETLQALVNSVGYATRPEALAAATLAIEPIFAVGGQEAIFELGRAINDVGRWYP